MRGEVANKGFTASPSASLRRTELSLGANVSAGAIDIVDAPDRDAATSAAKRTFDFVVSALLILLLTPALLLIALGIFVESGGPVIFRQDRGGLNGRLFTIYKFRTMRNDDGFGGWTQRGDDRITAFGQLLRRTSLDELPQLFNVLKGEMSLVGPRPHAAAMDDEYRALIAGYDNRLRVRPGITGLAQVSDLRGSVGQVDEMHMRLEADGAYIANWSMALDLRIIARTIPHLLMSGNAY